MSQTIKMEPSILEEEDHNDDVKKDSETSKHKITISQANAATLPAEAEDTGSPIPPNMLSRKAYETKLRKATGH